MLNNKIGYKLRYFKYRIRIIWDALREVDFVSQFDIEDLELDEKKSHRYQAVPSNIKKILKRMKISCEDSFLDFGCGKGLACYYAAHMPFNKIYGVDISETLVAIARRNFKVLAKKDGRMTKIRVERCDATQYEIPQEVNIIFMFNPFPYEVTQIVVDRIKDYCLENKKSAKVIFLNSGADKSMIFSEFNELFNYKYYHVYEYRVENETK